MYYYLKTHIKSGERDCTIEYVAHQCAEKIFVPIVTEMGEPYNAEVTPYVYLSALSQAAIGGKKAAKGYGLDEFISRSDSGTETDLTNVYITYWFNRKEGVSIVPEKVSIGLNNVHLSKENPIDPYEVLKEQTTLTKSKYDLIRVSINSYPEEECDF